MSPGKRPFADATAGGGQRSRRVRRAGARARDHAVADPETPGHGPGCAATSDREGREAHRSAGNPALRMLLIAQVSPTIFHAGGLHFRSFSREESRVHVQVESDQGEARIWIEPHIEVAENHHLPATTLTRALWEIRSHETQIREAWRAHLGA